MNDVKSYTDYAYTGMLILGLSLKAKFLGLGILWTWPCAFGLGLECYDLGINNKANRHII